MCNGIYSIYSRLYRGLHCSCVALWMVLEFHTLSFPLLHKATQASVPLRLRHWFRHPRKGKSVAVVGYSLWRRGRACGRAIISSSLLRYCNCQWSCTGSRGNGRLLSHLDLTLTLTVQQTLTLIGPQTGRSPALGIFHDAATYKGRPQGPAEWPRPRCGHTRSGAPLAVRPDHRTPSSNIYRLSSNAQTQLSYFHGTDDVICRSKRAKFARRGTADVSQNLQILAVAHVFFDVVFLYALRLFLRLRLTVQTVHFGTQTDEFARRDWASFALKFSQDTPIHRRILWMILCEIACVVVI